MQTPEETNPAKRERSPVRLNTAHEALKPEAFGEDPEAGEGSDVRVGLLLLQGLPEVKHPGGKAKINFGRKSANAEGTEHVSGTVSQNFLGGSTRLQEPATAHLNAQNNPSQNAGSQGAAPNPTLQKSDSLSPRSRTLLAAGNQGLLPSVAEEVQPGRDNQREFNRPVSNSDSFHSLASNPAAQDPLTAFGSNGRLPRANERDGQGTSQEQANPQRMNPRIKHANPDGNTNPASSGQPKDLRAPAQITSGLPSMMQHSIPDENILHSGDRSPRLAAEGANAGQHSANKGKPLEAAEIERILKEDQEKKKKKGDDREVVISMDNIQKTYLIGIEGVTAVRGVNLKVHKGEFLCILGTSGGGKSTLLNCMGTIDTPSRGTLKLFGNYMRNDTSDSEYAKTRLEKIGFVFQSFNLIGTMNSVENVELPMLLKGDLSPAEVKARAKELLTKVGLGHRLDHYPNQLSGGEQQRVTIARALSNEPELLLMDEPTGDLDTKNADKVVKILLDLNMRKENPITMVMVTHDEYMKQYAHRVIHIVDGKVNREEIMDPSIRLKAYAKINKIVQSYDDGTYAAIGVKEGAQASNVSGKTEIREVSDYAPMKFLLEKRRREQRMKG